ncbi:hypothetical protein D3C72_1313000 [compost metagenome]
MLTEAAALARLREIGQQACLVAARNQVQPQRGVAVAVDGVAQVGRKGVDQAAFDTVLAGHALALQRAELTVEAMPMCDDRLQRRTRVALREERCPRHVESAVGRLQRRDIHGAGLQGRNPCAVAAELRPASATQRQHRRVGAHVQHTRLGGKAQCAVFAPSQPAMVDVQAHALFLQPANPAAQQRCGLAVNREHAAGTADVGLHTEACGPVAQRLCVEAVQPLADTGGLLTVAAVEQRTRVGMGEVEPPLAGDQELAPRRALGLVQINVEPGRAQPFGGKQPRRAAADDGDATRRTCFTVGH